MKRAILVVMSWLVLAAGCGRQDQRVKISLSSWGDLKEAAILGDLCRMFEADNPGIKVQLQRVPYGEYNAKIMSQFVADKAADVLFVGSGQIVEYNPRGVLEPLNDYIARDGMDLTAYYPEVLDSFRLNTILYGLPRDIAPVACVFYNKDLFARNGLPLPKDDWSWDDLLRASQKLTRRDAKGNVTCWGYVDDWLSPESWFMSLGADWVDNWRNPQRYTLTDPNFIRGIQMRADLVYKYEVTPSQSAILALGGGSADLFMSGKAGLFFSGIWKAPLFRGIQGFDWDVVMFPKGPTGKRGFVSGGSGYGICNRSKHKDLAWRLVKFLTGKKAQEVFASTGLAQPAMIKVAESPAFLDDQKPLNKKMLLKAVKYGRIAPAALNWREVVESIIGPGLDRVWSGKETAQEAVDKIMPKLKDHPLMPINFMNATPSPQPPIRSKD